MSVKNGGSCPHWKNDRCNAYEDRPMECRLFPYTLGKLVFQGRRVSLTYHDRTRCPEKPSLLMPRAEAEAMIRQFVREVFGDVEKVDIRYEGFFTGWRYRLIRLLAP